MATCPRCGTEVFSLVKSWSMTGKPSKTGERLKLTIGLYECPECGKKFRVALEKEKISIKEMTERIQGIEEGLRQTLRTLREKIETLEREKADLLKEIEELKKAAEEKAEALEGEVAMLRREARELKDLLEHPTTT